MKVKFFTTHQELQYVFDIDWVSATGTYVYFYKNDHVHYSLKYDGERGFLLEYNEQYCVDSPRDYNVTGWKIERC